MTIFHLADVCSTERLSQWQRVSPWLSSQASVVQWHLPNRNTNTTLSTRTPELERIGPDKRLQLQLRPVLKSMLHETLPHPQETMSFFQLI